MQILGNDVQSGAAAFFASSAFSAASTLDESIKQAARTIARLESPVIILGEPGFAKETLARFIHQNSPRGSKPLIPFDCRALEEVYLERELFGHVKGAFPGANRDSMGCIRAADTGTLFLDEFWELSPRMQSRLLRVLDEKKVLPIGGQAPRPVNIRIIASTSHPAHPTNDAGTNYHKLYFRLNASTLTIPAGR
jgi:transcriptional regulator with PAS, ATPase and Fis domain